LILDCYAAVINLIGLTRGSHAQPTYDDHGKTDADFAIDPTPVTVENFWSGRHYSVGNYSRTALLGVTQHDGSKPAKAPAGASEEKIAAAEARLGVRLPETLRRLYKLCDGGSAQHYMIAMTPDPAPIFDDYQTAFPYDDIVPLADLESVSDNYTAYKSEEDPPAAEWLAGCQRMIILSYREETLLLDYRDGEAPKVVIADLTKAPEAHEIATFENFDTFFAALRRMEEPQLRTGATLPRSDISAVSVRPEQFWAWSAQAATRAATAQEIIAQEHNLGLKLPEALQNLYRTADGGAVAFTRLSQMALDDQPFPNDGLLAAGKLVTLKTLSGRIDFMDGAQPWTQIHEKSDHLLVLGASYDTALMLDYSELEANEEPAVLWLQTLDDPASNHVRYNSFTEFLGALRLSEHPSFIGDTSLSPLAPTPETFLISSRGPASAVALEETKDRLGLALPGFLADVYAHHDGGRVIFNHLPPQIRNPYGDLNAYPKSTDWAHVFRAIG